MPFKEENGKRFWTCPYCNKWFEEESQGTISNLFCSEECRQKYCKTSKQRGKKPANCKNCGIAIHEPVYVIKKWKKKYYFCSKQCLEEFKEDCKNCGITIHHKPVHWIGKRNRIYYFCSKECRQKFKERTRELPRERRQRHKARMERQKERLKE